MDVVNKFNKTKKLLTEEEKYAFYADVASQLEQGQRDIGVWTKAFADADGDEKKAKAIYIELMVEKLALAKEAALEIQSQIKYEKEEKIKEKAKKDKKAARKLENAKTDAKEQAKMDHRKEKFGFLYWIPFYLYIPIVGFLSPSWWDIILYSIVYIAVSTYIYHFIFLDIFMGKLLGYDLIKEKKSKIRNKKVIKKLDALKDIVKNLERSQKPLYKRHYSTLNDLLNTFHEEESFYTPEHKDELRIIVKKAIKDLPKTYTDDKVMLKKREQVLKEFTTLKK